MSNPEQWDALIGQAAVDADGNKIGKVGQIYVDDATGQPQWVTVSTGMLGNRESFAPLYNARPGDGELRLAVSKQLVKDAPNIDNDGHIEDSEIAALYRHYADYLGPSASQANEGQMGEGSEGAGYTDTAPAGTGYADTAGTGVQGHDTSGPTTDNAMTRSEERLHVGTESAEVGRARLRKYVVTENVTRTVPVSHEEVRVEREPITDANRDAALDGPGITEEEHEVTLRAERPVVEKETVPVERVRLGTETVTEERQVNEELRKEQIEEPDVDANPRGGDR